MFSARESRRKAARNVEANRKRMREDVEENGTCSFCGQIPACVAVKTPLLFRKKLGSSNYCLTCYYTTSAVRQDPSKYVSICNQHVFDEQLQPMQELFAEAYVDLQKMLEAESEAAFSKQKADPLALLHSGTSQRRTSNLPSARRPIAEKKKAGDAGDGGFLRSIPVPMRLIQTQKEQARLQQAQIQRMNRAAAVESAEATSSLSKSADLYKRRRSSTKSIWHMAMDQQKVSQAAASEKLQEYLPACKCGSKNVQSVGNVTSRNQDLKKGETWGMKDRGEDVVARYRCEDCGRVWNEEE